MFLFTLLDCTTIHTISKMFKCTSDITLTTFSVHEGGHPSHCYYRNVINAEHLVQAWSWKHDQSRSMIGPSIVVRTL